MMQRMKISLVVVGFGLLLTNVPAVAHHAFGSEFDANKIVELQGTISKVEWVDPHSWIHIDVKKTDGTVETWMIEGGTPNTLLRRGITKTSLLVGTEVKVFGFQSKDGAKRANGRDVTLPNGQKLFLGGQGTGAPYEGAAK